MAKDDTHTAPTRIELPETAYWQAFQAQSHGVLKWEAFHAMWEDLAARPEGWFVYHNPETDPAPEAPVTAEGFADALRHAEELVAPWRGRSYFGLVYVDDPQAPTYIRVFDPKNMGSSCSISDEPVLPAMILSRIKPDAVRHVPVAPPRKGLFSRFGATR